MNSSVPSVGTVPQPPAGGRPCTARIPWSSTIIRFCGGRMHFNSTHARRAFKDCYTIFTLATLGSRTHPPFWPFIQALLSRISPGSPRSPPINFVPCRFAPVIARSVDGRLRYLLDSVVDQWMLAASLVLHIGRLANASLSRISYNACLRNLAFDTIKMFRSTIGFLQDLSVLNLLNGRRTAHLP